MDPKDNAMQQSRLFHCITVFTTFIFLSACGGSSDSDPAPADTAVPPETAVSDTGAVADNGVSIPDNGQTKPDVNTPTPDIPPPEPDTGDPTQPVDLGIACTLNDNNCPPESFCKISGCNTKTQGTCIIPAMMCPDDFSPVCTCTDNTFDSPCIADLAMQNVQKMGTCDGNVQVCIVGMDGMCESGMFCDGPCWQSGVCKPMPSQCPQEDNVVCGCDGVIYPNPCIANASNVSVNHPGPCLTEEGTSCGGQTNDVCGLGQKCNVESCEPYWPGQCTSVENCDGNPECGCDGVTYDNICARLEVEVAKYHDGPCLPGGGLPTCTVSVANSGKCGEDYWQNGAAYFCYASPGQCEAEGICKSRPASCDGLEWPQVCGCNDVTYDNLCVAWQNDMPAKLPQPCEESN